MGDAPKEWVVQAHIQDNQIVFDEPVQLPEGQSVVVRIEAEEIQNPSPGTWDSVRELFGQIKAPPGFDPRKVTREDMYD